MTYTPRHRAFRSRDRRAMVLALLLLLALVLLALAIVPAVSAPGSAPGSAPRRATPRITEATQNVYRANPPAAIRHDVRQAMDHASVVRLQEVYPGRPVAAAVRRVLANRPAWRATALGRVEVPILWDSRVWARAGHPRVRLLTHGRPARGWPPRFLVWVPLEHRATGRVLTVANVHPLPAYCRPSTYADDARQADASTHWRAVQAWTLTQRAAHPARPILLGGDFNCRLAVRALPWFPARLLGPLYRFDRSDSIDRLIRSRGVHRPEAVRRWSMAARSDHRLQLQTLRVR